MSHDVEGTGQRFVCLNLKVKVLTLRSRSKVKRGYLRWCTIDCSLIDPLFVVAPIRVGFFCV